jgi:hypothetical protein
MEDNKLKHSFVKQSNTDVNEFLQTLRDLSRSIGIQPFYTDQTIVDYYR